MSIAAIETQSLHKVFNVGFGGLRRVEALRGLDLTVQPGSIYGFLGPNGAGKSTTIKTLTRLILPTSGKALVFGKPLDTREARRRVGYLPENPVFYDYLTGTELLAYYGALLGLDRNHTRKRAEGLLERVGLAKAGRLQIRRYSKGMVQRLGIAQALLGDPELVILDEPVSGLDPIGRREMRELILELKDTGKTVFFSTHVIPDVEMICDRVGIIIGGRMVREGTVAELLDEGLAVTEVIVRGLDSSAASQVVPGLDVRSVGPGLAVHIPADTGVGDILKKLLSAGAEIVSVQPQRRALEDIFIEEIATRGGGEDEAPRASIRGSVGSSNG